MKVLVFLLIISSFFSCVDESKKNKVPPVSDSLEIDLLDTLQLRLNHGDKWMVNDETHVGISKMDSIIKSFKLNSQKDYVVLGKNLSNQTSFVIKNCTMKGESHDQLHVVLVPMLDEISILKEIGNDSEEALHILESLIAEYFEYFKL